MNDQEAVRIDELRTRPDELRKLFLFEALTPGQLEWVAAHGEVERYAQGAAVIREGDPATCFYVLLEGTLRLTRQVRGSEIEINRTGQRGVYTGATQFVLAERQPDQRYMQTVYALTDCALFQLPARELGDRFREWFPMATHLLEGLFEGGRNIRQIVEQRERLLALGSLSAALTHELNNPAAAAARATASLRERVAGMRHKLALLAKHDIDPNLLEKLIDVQEDLVKRVADAPQLSAVESSDREDELTDWLDEHGIAEGWDMAPSLVPAGITVRDLDGIAESVGDTFVTTALRWLTYSLETETLMGEIEDATSRISNLLAAARQYSQMDRAPYQRVDVHQGLDSTLVMMARKIGPEVRVVKEYDRSLPPIPAYPGELNQVWTNLIDNAVSAMDRKGTLTVRTTATEDGCVQVEIADTGSGIPKENLERIFEPFFTTKPMGEGTGLGLDISYKIVVNRHHGDLRVTSRPGDTRFQVILPVQEQTRASEG